MAANLCSCMLTSLVLTPLECNNPQEECRGWDVNEVVFTPALWPVYQALMRADFTLFDEYEFAGIGADPMPWSGFA